MCPDRAFRRSQVRILPGVPSVALDAEGEAGVPPTLVTEGRLRATKVLTKNRWPSAVTSKTLRRKDDDLKGTWKSGCGIPTMGVSPAASMSTAMRRLSEVT